MRRGRALEKLVKLIESSLGQEGQATYDSPKWLHDKAAEKKREFDVVISINAGPRVLLVGIECKDWARPVGSSTIDAFVTKCNDVGVDRRIIVSSSGFTKSAITKAENHSIQCLTLTEAESFDWLIPDFFQLRYKKLIHTDWLVIPEEKALKPPGDFKIVNEKGEEFTSEILQANLLRNLDKIPFEEPFNTEHNLECTFNGDGLFVKSEGLEDLLPIGRIVANTTFVDVVEPLPLKLSSYVDKTTGEKITDVAVAEVNSPGFKGRFAIVYNAEKGGKVILVQDSKGKKKKKGAPKSLKKT